jgi:hypothetical protein
MDASQPRDVCRQPPALADRQSESPSLSTVAARPCLAFGAATDVVSKPWSRSVPNWPGLALLATRSAKQPISRGRDFLRNPRQNIASNEYSLTGLGLLALSNRMDGRPKVGWFQAQALQCIALALRAKDPRIKRLYALEAEQWLHLAELRTDHSFRYNRAPEYQGVERRTTARHLARKAGVILLERDALVECAVRDFSPAGVGLSLPDCVSARRV